MRFSAATLSVLSSLLLAACSSVSVESEARLSPAAPAFARTLVVVALPDALRRPAEDTLVARLASLHAQRSYDHVSLAGDVTLGALRETARRDGCDALLVVWSAGLTEKAYPSVGSYPIGLPASLQIGLRLVASLTALDGDREIWKGVATHPDAYPLAKGTPKMTAGLADRLISDGVANP